MSDEPKVWDLTDWDVLEVGAPVLALTEEDGVLFVTTTKGTFPVSLDEADQ